MKTETAGKIFINYRRDDEPGFVHALFPRLEAAFGRNRLFMDVEGYIAAGDDFVEVLDGQVAQCDVLLVIIGPRWLDAKDESGSRRLENPDDFVRIEIVAALTKKKRVIPVLVNNAQVPRGDRLPDDLKPLARRNAVRLAHERFAADCEGLIKELTSALQKAALSRGAQAAETARSEQVERAQQQTEARVQEAEARAREGERRREAQLQRTASEGLPSQDTREAEELANWEFVQSSSEPEDLRDHIARFPGGSTEAEAQARLEHAVWEKLAARPSLDALQGFLNEFPASRFAESAREQIYALQVGGQRGLIRSQRDFIAALIFLAVGTIASWQGSALALSSGEGIGPGFLPRLAAAALVLLGLASLIKAFVVRTPPIGEIAWRPLGAAMASLGLFALLYEGAGLVAAMIVSILASAAATPRIHWPATLGVMVLVTAVAVMLVKALGLAMPLVGKWLVS